MSIFLYLIFTWSVNSQIVINVGPYSTYFPDPLAHSQENRAASEDLKMIPKVSLMATEVQLSKDLVVDYEKSLETISSSMNLRQKEIDHFLDECIDYIVAKSSISGNIPGLSKIATKSRLIAFTQTNKIRTLKAELKTVFKTDNYMTEGERKILLLDIIDRALYLTI
ncbi:hypothetical protein [Flavobacterium poyangense]|uniref:hypothetical protein n=1 Tax=Flavobacterium poyangense TaxID=2204302 RepID=UPI001422CE54|nr:hypothetical protein [Flavobacterium sp. JXAS1]